MKRPCKLCGKEVDFSEPYCDHETMEESALLDIRDRIQVLVIAQNEVLDKAVEQAAKDLLENKNGDRAGN